MSETSLITVVSRELAAFEEMYKGGAYYLFGSYYADGEINY